MCRKCVIEFVCVSLKVLSCVYQVAFAPLNCTYFQTDFPHAEPDILVVHKQITLHNAQPWEHLAQPYNNPLLHGGPGPIGGPQQGNSLDGELLFHKASKKNNVCFIYSNDANVLGAHSNNCDF